MTIGVTTPKKRSGTVFKRRTNSTWIDSLQVRNLNFVDDSSKLAIELVKSIRERPTGRRRCAGSGWPPAGGGSGGVGAAAAARRRRRRRRPRRRVEWAGRRAASAGTAPPTPGQSSIFFFQYFISMFPWILHPFLLDLMSSACFYFQVHWQNGPSLFVLAIESEDCWNSVTFRWESWKNTTYFGGGIE